MAVRKQLFKLCDELFEKKDENTKEIFPKKVLLLLFYLNKLVFYHLEWFIFWKKRYINECLVSLSNKY